MIRPTPVPRVRGGRRYCIYDKYFAKGRAAGFETEEMAPILFYTGNESPHEPPPTPTPPHPPPPPPCSPSAATDVGP